MALIGLEELVPEGVVVLRELPPRLAERGGPRRGAQEKHPRARLVLLCPVPGRGLRLSTSASSAALSSSGRSSAGSRRCDAGPESMAPLWVALPPQRSGPESTAAGAELPLLELS